MTRESFKEMFDLYFEDIRRYIFYRGGDPVLADDIAQQTFLKVWEKQMKIIPGKEKGLLFKMAGDEFIDQVRKKKREIDFSAAFYEKNLDVTPEEVFESKELNQRFTRVLNTMKESSRIVFMMSRNDDLTYQEIATSLNISVKAVEKRMKGALDKFRQEFQKE